MSYNRIRTTNDLSSSALSITRSGELFGAPGYEVYGSTPVGKQKTVSDVSGRLLPGILMRDVSMVTVDNSSWDCNLTFSRYNNRQNVSYRGPLGLMMTLNAPVINLESQCSLSDVRDAVLVDAYAKINENQVVTGELVADLGKTVAMLRSPLTGVQNIMRSTWSRWFTRAGLRRAGRNIRSSSGPITYTSSQLASIWLEITYGIRPLLMDAATILDNYSSFRGRLPSRTLVFRSARKQNRVLSQPLTDYYFGIPAIWVSGTAEASLQRRTSAGVIVEFKINSTCAQVVQDYSLGVSSIAPTLWEIMPYSFVVDWFANFGKLIQAHNLPPNATVLGNWVTVVEDRKSAFYGTDVYTSSSPGQAHGLPGNGVRSRNTYTRQANRELTINPTMSFDFSSWSHLTSGIALSVGSINRLIRSFAH